MKQLFFIASLILVLASCNQNRSAPATIGKDISVADTIVYEALIHNTDTSEPWKNDWLKHLDRVKLIDQLFESAYSKKVDVVDYFSKEPMSLEQIKEWESGNPRTAIGKLQFTETWGWDAKSGGFYKKVIAVMPAYESFTDDGQLRGYKAGVQFVMKDK